MEVTQSLQNYSFEYVFFTAGFKEFQNKEK